MKKTLSVIIIQIFNLTFSSAQIPHITGIVKLSVQKGTFECDLKISNIPEIKNYYIFLNSGFNIRYFRNIEDNFNYFYNKNYDETVPEECFGYYFPDNTDKSKFLPKAFQISYTGAYPVISDTLKVSEGGDWKGNIAYNGKTVRATEQSAWYPIIYDITKDLQYSKVAYDIKIICNDCETIYLNGNIPVKGKMAHLNSDSAFQLLLFAGNYKVDTMDNTYFLNIDMTPEQFKEFGKMTDNYKKFYEKKLTIPYTSSITYLQTTPVSKYNSFFFVTHPSIVAIGWNNGFKECLGEKKNWFKPFIAHELGHYYFGNYAKFNSELGLTIQESFAEFLSLKASKNFLGDSIYNAKINNYLEKLDGFNPVPVGKILSVIDTSSELYNEIYSYSYFPIILVAIEKEIGEEKMWRWLKLILTTKTEFTNYEFLKNTLNMTLQDQFLQEKIEKKYFKSDMSMQNAISLIQWK